MIENILVIAVLLITGLMCVGVGFLAKKDPDIIAGYNTMSAERKKDIDIDGLANFVFRSSIVLGILISIPPSIGWLLCKSAGIITWLILIPSLASIPWFAIGARRFDNRRKRRKTG